MPRSLSVRWFAPLSLLVPWAAQPAPPVAAALPPPAKMT